MSYLKLSAECVKMLRSGRAFVEFTLEYQNKFRPAKGGTLKIKVGNAFPTLNSRITCFGVDVLYLF